MNKTLTSFFFILAFLFLYACSSSDPTPTPPITTTYKVTFNPNTPSASSATVSNLPAQQNVNEGDLATEPTPPPTLDGYTFGGWYTEASTTTAFQFSTKITQDTTLYAKWTPRQTFTITYHANKPSDAPPEATVTGVPENPVSIPEGQTATAPTPPTLTGYNFAEWYTEEAATNPFDFTQVITANIDLYAKWNIQQFTITYHANKPSDAPQEATVTGVSTTPVTVNSGDRPSPPTPPTLANYNFVGWYTEATTTSQFDFSQGITANIDLYAKWTQDPVVSFNMQGGSPIESQTLTGTSKRATRPDNPAREDYTFDYWYTMATGGTLFDFSQTITAQSTTVYARWNRIMRTVTYHANKPDDAPSGVSVSNLPDPATVNVNSGDMATEPTATPELEDYVFQGWFAGTISGGTLALQDTTFAFETTAIKENKDLYAKWTRKEITITFYGNKPSTAPEGATITGLATDPTIVTVNSGDTTTALSPPPELTGYSLDGWFISTTSEGTPVLQDTAFDFTTTIRGENINLYAKWLQKFTVTYHGNKPQEVTATVTGVSTTPVTVNNGDRTLAPNDPTLAGYNFVGWYTEATATNPFDFSQGITTSIDLYAKWSQDPVVTFDTQGGNNIMSQTITGSVTKATRPDDPAREDYTFDNWYTMATGGTLFDFSTTTPITSSVTVYAQWNRIMRTVTYHGNKPDTVPRGVSVTNLPDPATVNVDSGDTTPPPATPPVLQDYVFQGWFAGTITGTTPMIANTAFVFETTAIKENKDLYAKWTRKEITISFYGNKPSTAPEGATITGLATDPTIVTVNSGDTTTALAPELTGYTLDGWFIGTTSGGTLALQDTAFDFTTTTIRGENINLYAKWTQDPVVTFDTQGGSEIASQTITYPVTMAARPQENPTREGYVFGEWYTMATGGDVFVFTRTITASITVYAQWIQQFTVTYHANKPSDAPEGATVTGVSTTPVPVNNGDRTSAPNDPTLAGYNFVGWYTDEAATNQFNFSQVITANIDLYAKWSQNPIVTFDTQGGNNIDSQTITGSVTMAVRPDVAPTREGYVFDNWYTMATGGDVYDFSATTPITASITVYAQWIQQFTVTYHGNKPSDAPEGATVTGVSTAPVTVNSGDTPSVPNDPTLANYNFVGWYTEEATTNPFNFSQGITTSIDLYAKWSALPTFTVTYNVNKPTGAIDEVMEVPTTVNVINDLTTTEPSPEPTLVGYTFEGWYTEATATNKFDFSTNTITENIELYAKWTIQEFTVTYNANKPSGATANVAGMPTNVMINYNLATAEPSPKPTLVGYTFEGWYTEANATNLFVFSTTAITENIDLYAKWVFRPSTKLELLAEINRAITPTTPSPNLNYIDTSLINDMSFLFQNKSDFNGNISGWNVSNVVNMNNMFSEASTFNGDINNWNVSKVTNMNSMFSGATAFNQNISSWNVSLVEHMSYMFSETTAFNQNISSWNVAKVANMGGMFAYATVFNQNISNWNVSLVENMSSMFSGATAFNGYISSWNVAKVTNMSDMFSRATAFNQNISSWNVSLVENMSSMFSGATAFNGYISSWNVSKVENMSFMFNFASTFNGNISSWNVAKVANMSNMFNEARVFNQNISNWNVSLVENMSNMFRTALAFNGNISSWNVAKVANMSNMFHGARVFNQDISSWNVAKVANMNAMFSGAIAFNQNISSWNVAKVTEMSGMFGYATAFNQNISSWNVSLVKNMSYMFRNATAFNGNISNWRPTALTNMSNMFKNASAFAQNINSWNIASTVDKTDAFIGSGLEAKLPSWAM